MNPPCPFCDIENPPRDHVIRCYGRALRVAGDDVDSKLRAHRSFGDWEHADDDTGERIFAQFGTSTGYPEQPS